MQLVAFCARSGCTWERPHRELKPVATSTRPGESQQKVQSTPRPTASCQLYTMLSYRQGLGRYTIWVVQGVMSVEHVVFPRLMRIEIWH